MNNGSGVAWKGDALSQQADGPFSGFGSSSREEERAETEQVELHDKGRLGIDALGGLSRHPRIAVFREFIEGFDLSQFAPDAARSMPLAGPRKHLNVRGDNPGDVTQFMEREHQDRLAGVLRKMNEGIHYADRIGTERNADGRLLLRIEDWCLTDSSQAQEMSDCMLKALAYLLVLETPSPPTLIGIKEPGKGLHRKLLEILVHDLRGRASNTRKSTQIFVTTNQPDLADALRPNEVWILEKGEDGFSTISRASHDETVWELVGEPELRLGGLWRSGYLG